jgi:anti-sigma B factor antagonist
MNLERRIQGSILIVKLAGQLDLMNLQSLKHEIDTLAPGIVYMVIECESLNLIDSAGFGALLQADAACKARKGRLILSGMPDRLRKILRLTRLDTVLVVSDSLDEALQFAGESAG